MAPTPLQQLAEHGQSVWIDYLSRPFVKDGDLAGLVEQGVDGVTSNPTIFQGAIAEGDAYDDQIREAERRDDDPKEIFWRSPRDDIRDACDILRPSGTRATARTAGSRSRSTRTSRTTPRRTIAEADAPARARRPPEPVHQDPRHAGGPAGDRGARSPPASRSTSR